MIPTSYKAKLSRHLSYPIGAQAIGDALAGSPHLESLSAKFSAAPVWPGAEFRRVLSEQLPYTIMAGCFTPTRSAGFISSNDWVRRGYNDEKWEVWVYPVLAEFRHLANGLLLEHGMPAVARWLNSSTRPGWLSKPQRIDVIFKSDDGTLAIGESGGI